MQIDDRAQFKKEPLAANLLHTYTFSGLCKFSIYPIYPSTQSKMDAFMELGWMYSDASLKLVNPQRI